ncbi:hemin uptake protein HemP [Roseovarius sp. THAF9]|uniref:hemin uptake protein HemP n=1 Tax=Roseovarius sp. THAF9 TaxID=2587847 RepID=UPI0020C7CC3B|nr:hemin uptake protein HemP [Roseovarius sp. THAF9]
MPQLVAASEAGEAHDTAHDARELTRGQTTAQITLDGKVYTLRITRAGKLILTK